MATNSQTSGAQLMLFEVEQSKQPDGSFRVMPKRVALDREISVERAMQILGFRDRHTIYDMLNSGQLRGWKPDSKRGNAKWRIYEESVMSYKAARQAATGF